MSGWSKYTTGKSNNLKNLCLERHKPYYRVTTFSSEITTHSQFTVSIRVSYE